MKKPASKKHSFFYRNGLSLVFLALFTVTLGAQALTGWKEHNKELKQDGVTEIGLGQYLKSGQKGSPESKPVDAPHLETGK
ncbi:hypothetical protein ACVWYN_000081 [Pedobacter sp. UYP24]